MRNCGALSRCSIAVLYRDEYRDALSRCLSRCVIAMFIAMRYRDVYRDASFDALSRCILRCAIACIIAGRYRDAAVQFYIANFICGHLCDALSWGISRRFLKWGFGSKSFCCNTSGCIAIFGWVVIIHITVYWGTGYLPLYSTYTGLDWALCPCQLWRRWCFRGRGVKRYDVGRRKFCIRIQHSLGASRSG